MACSSRARLRWRIVNVDVEKHGNDDHPATKAGERTEQAGDDRAEEYPEREFRCAHALTEYNPDQPPSGVCANLRPIDSNKLTLLCAATDSFQTPDL